MRKFISICLALAVLICSFSFSFSAYADSSNYYLQREQYNTHNNIAGGFYGKNAYFINNHSEKLYIKKSVNGKAKSVRKGVCAGGCHTIYKNYVYYLGEDGCLKKCSVNGKVKKKIISKNINIIYLIVAYDKIFFLAEDPYGDIGYSGLYECDLNGKHIRRITKHFADHFYSWGKNIYYYDLDSKCFKRYNPKNKKIYRIKFNKAIKNPEIIGMEGSSIYYYYYSTVGYAEWVSFYKADVKTKKVTCIGDTKVSGNFHFIVANKRLYAAVWYNDDDTVYYYKYTDNYKPFRLIKSLPFSRVCATDMGFYRNKIITVKYKNNKPTSEYYVIATIK